MIKVVIFDIGNVLNTYKPGSYFRNLARISGRDARTVNRLLGKDGERAEKGLMPISRINEKAAKRLRISMKEADYMAFFSKHSRPNRGMIRYANSLRKRYTIACLSNIEPETYAFMKKPGLLPKFDYEFLSFRIGARKPSGRIYRYALRKLKVKPSEAIFIDDMKRNISAARKMGINAILFRNLKELKKRMSAFEG